MSYPTSIDNLASSRGATGNPLNNPNHITHHTNEDTAIQALETKVGIDSSADTTSIDYLLKSTSSSNPGHKHTVSNITDFPTFVDGEVHTIASDGQTTMTLSFTPIAGSVKLFYNGTRLNSGAQNDYTISGATVTFILITTSGDVVLADYRR